ncbi:hypothetical protein IW261DRAFT_929833 [Armillaria novae-zelandiae]|uniref:Uncharacterized protein n=1 Tax=Armillaria novae-zelandiae TaxID=153914 RepID=A0AA39NS03_9AGAR|nr:hypothetical protein IW261DRAFT_929833 [Armillaria novae-zelandiae]
MSCLIMRRHPPQNAVMNPSRVWGLVAAHWRYLSYVQDPHWAVPGRLRWGGTCATSNRPSEHGSELLRLLFRDGFLARRFGTTGKFKRLDSTRARDIGLAYSIEHGCLFNRNEYHIGLMIFNVDVNGLYSKRAALRFWTKIPFISGLHRVYCLPKCLGCFEVRIAGSFRLRGTGAPRRSTKQAPVDHRVWHRCRVHSIWAFESGF